MAANELHAILDGQYHFKVVEKHILILYGFL